MSINQPIAHVQLVTARVTKARELRRAKIAEGLGKDWRHITGGHTPDSSRTPEDHADTIPAPPMDEPFDPVERNWTIALGVMICLATAVYWGAK